MNWLFRNDKNWIARISWCAKWIINYESLARSNLMHVMSNKLLINYSSFIHDYSWLITNLLKSKSASKRSSDLMDCDIFHNRLRDQKSRQRKKTKKTTDLLPDCFNSWEWRHKCDVIGVKMATSNKSDIYTLRLTNKFFLWNKRF